MEIDTKGCENSVANQTLPRSANIDNHIAEILHLLPENVSSKSEKVEISEALHTAADAFSNEQYHAASLKYRLVLDMCIENKFEIVGVRRDVVQYMLCLCLSESKELKDLLEALQCLLKLEENIGNTFPAVYYALGKIHIKFFRFEMAQEVVNKGIALLNTDTTFQCSFIPGTKIVIPESTKEGLLEALIRLKEEHSKWHRPDAICNTKNCQNYNQYYPANRNIFFSDPTFNGMVTVTCNNQTYPCVLKYHQICWKYEKEQMCTVKKLSDKDMIGQKCLTPSCENNGVPNTIMRIEIYAGDANLKSVIEVPKLVPWPKRQVVVKGAIKKQAQVLPAQKPRKQSLMSFKQMEVPVLQKPCIKETHNEQLEKQWRINKLMKLRESNFGIPTEKNWRPDMLMYGNEHMIATMDFLPDPEFSDSNPKIIRLKTFVFEILYDYIKTMEPLSVYDVVKKWEDTKVIIDDLEGHLENLDVMELLLLSQKLAMIGDHFCTPQNLPQIYNRFKSNIRQRFSFVIESNVNGEKSKIDCNEEENKKCGTDSNVVEDKVTETVDSEEEKNQSEMDAYDIIPKMIAANIKTDEEKASECYTITEKNSVVVASDNAGSPGLENPDFPNNVDLAPPNWQNKNSDTVQDMVIESDVFFCNINSSVNTFQSKPDNLPLIQTDDKTKDQSRNRRNPFLFYEESENCLLPSSVQNDNGLFETCQTDIVDDVSNSSKEIDQFAKKTNENQPSSSVDKIIDAENVNVKLLEEHKLLQEENLRLKSEVAMLSQDKIGANYNIRLLLKEKNTKVTSLTQERDALLKKLEVAQSTLEKYENLQEIVLTLKSDMEALLQDKLDSEHNINLLLQQKNNAILTLTQSFQNEREYLLRDIETCKLELSETTKQLDALRTKYTEMKKQMLQKCLSYQYMGNKYLLSGNKERCNTALEVINRVNYFSQKTMGCHILPDHVEWLQALNAFHVMFNQQEEEYGKLNVLLESKQEVENRDDILLLLTPMPPYPKRSLADAVYNACMQYHMTQRPGFQPAVPLYHCVPPANPFIPFMFPNADAQIPPFPPVNPNFVAPMEHTSSSNNSSTQNAFQTPVNAVDSQDKNNENAKPATEATKYNTTEVDKNTVNNASSAQNVDTRKATKESEVSKVGVASSNAGDDSKSMSFENETLRRKRIRTRICDNTQSMDLNDSMESIFSDTSTVSISNIKITRNIEEIIANDVTNSKVEYVKLKNENELSVEDNARDDAVKSKQESGCTLVNPTDTTVDAAIKHTDTASNTVIKSTDTVRNTLIKFTDTISNTVIKPTDTEPNTVIRSPDTASNTVIKPTDTASNAVIKPTDAAPNKVIKSTDTTSNNVIKSTETASNTVIKPMNSAKKRTTNSFDILMHLLQEEHPGLTDLDFYESILSVRQKYKSLTGMSIKTIMKALRKHLLPLQEKYLCNYVKSKEKTSENSIWSENYIPQKATISELSKQVPSNHISSPSYQVLSKSNIKLDQVSQVQRNRQNSTSSTSSASSVKRESPANTFAKCPWEQIPQRENTWKKESEETECIICMESLRTPHKVIYTLICQHTFHKKCIKDWYQNNQSCPTCRVHSTIDDEYPPLPC